jgi:sugar phosphate isomerase/epimerase
LHCKENGSVLGEGRIDFPRVRKTLDEIGYDGWLVIESSVGEGKTMLESYHHNVQFLRKLFP